MKKTIALVFGALFLFSAAQAAVTVTRDGKTAKYENGSTVTVTGQSAAVVNYNGVKISVPAGSAVTITENADGSVRITGTNVAGVKVGSNTVSASGPVSFSVSPKTNAITVNRGTLVVQNASGRTTTVAAGSSYSGAAAEATASSVPAFVNEAVLGENTVSQQATQDVEETLSPSSPRN